MNYDDMMRYEEMMRNMFYNDDYELMKELGIVESDYVFDQLKYK